MRRRTLILSTASSAMLGVAPAHARTAKPAPHAAEAAAVAAPAGSVVLAPWAGPFGGLPPFGRITVADLKPALTVGMALCRSEIDRIANDPTPPSFGNTVVALERAGEPLGRAMVIFGLYTSNLSDEPMRALEAEMSPVLAAFSDETTQNPALWQRIDAVQRSSAAAGLAPEQRRLLEVVHRRFTRAGAALDAAGKARVKEINQRLATLYTRFSQNQLADEENDFLLLASPADLEGLPQDLKDTAAAAATAAGQPGQWRFANTRSAMEPFLTSSSRRDLRERGWRMWVQRGDHGGATDNKAVITEILRLRGERARLLGFATHAHWVTADKMSGTPEVAMALMMRVWRAATQRAHEEIADMQAVADREGAKLRIEPWDYRYYADKVRREKFSIDGDAMKPYLQMSRMRDAMFWAAGQLHGLSFRPLRGAPVYQADITAYSVHRAGKPVGVWYFDPYARAGKSSGAWMSEYRSQRRLDGAVLPVVSNNANFIPPAAGEPVLISWDDAVTLFHEFGHAIHGLSSNVTYPTLAGTAVNGDFGEFPSQLNERWLSTPEVLGRFALHHETGRPMPGDMLDAVKRARNFNQGFATAEYLASALYDMRIHLAPAEAGIDPGAFEADLLAEIGCPREIVMRHRPTHFGHIFAGEGYSAGYGDYLWADTLTADAAEAFTAAGGFYDKRVARRLHDCILAVGNSVPPQEAFRRFRGRDVDVDALMRERGFPVA